jgi:predicted site-specific integrase-resolvase
MRAKELAVALAVSLATVWNYAKEGKIKAIKLSARVTVFDYNAIERQMIVSRNLIS